MLALYRDADASTKDCSEVDTFSPYSLEMKHLELNGTLPERIMISTFCDFSRRLNEIEPQPSRVLLLNAFPVTDDGKAAGVDYTIRYVTVNPNSGSLFCNGFDFIGCQDYFTYDDYIILYDNSRMPNPVEIDCTTTSRTFEFDPAILIADDSSVRCWFRADAEGRLSLQSFISYYPHYDVPVPYEF